MDSPATWDDETIPAGTGGSTVLVAEDDAATRELLATALGKDGYAVIATASGEEALRVLAAREVDLVLADVRMGTTSGIAVAEAVRARGDTPVILMTAFPEPAVFDDARRLDVAVLPKPFKLELLRRAVSSTLASRARPNAR